MIAKAARSPRLPLRIYGKYKRETNKPKKKTTKREKSLCLCKWVSISVSLVHSAGRSRDEVEVGLNITINLVGEVGKIFGIEIY